MRTSAMTTMLRTCGAALALSGCGGGAPSDGNTVTIGLLLPFTGTASATSGNFERAVLYAAGRINDGGGVQGRRLRVVSQDTHSDLARSRGSADALVAALNDGAAQRGFEQSNVHAGPAVADPLAAVDVVICETERPHANHVEVGPPAATLQKQPVAKGIGEGGGASFARAAAIDENVVRRQNFGG